MAIQIVVQVQVDRLPQFRDANDKLVSQFGLRISSLVHLDPTDTLPSDKLSSIARELCPWHWTWPDPDKYTKLGIHNSKAWRVFALRKSNGWTPVKLASGDIRPPPPKEWPDFEKALDAKIEQVVQSSGVAALAPSREGPVSGATVFGIVESVSDLPYPLPTSSNVFAVFETTEDLSDARLIALPDVVLDSGGFDVDKATIKVTNADDLTDPSPTAIATAAIASGTPWAYEALFELHASLLEPAMGRSANSERLLDLSILSVAHSNRDVAIGDDDYCAELPSRLAEAIDPAARIAAAFEGAMARLDKKTLSTIRSDLADPSASWLVEIIDRMSARMFFPTANGSHSIPSIALLYLGALAQGTHIDASERDEETVAAGQILLQMLDDADRKPAATPDRSIFASMPISRFMSAAGMLVDKNHKDESSVINLEGLVEFTRKWWFSVNSNEHSLSAKATRRLAQRLMPDTIPVDVGTLLSPDIEPVLSSEILRSPGISFVLRLDGANAKLLLQIGRHGLRIERTGANALNAGFIGQTPSTIALDVKQSLRILLRLSDDKAMLLAQFNDSSSTQLETPSLDLPRRQYEIIFTAETGNIDDIRPAPPETLAADKVAAKITKGMLRANFASAFAGPFIPGVLSGRQDWATQHNPSVSLDFKQAIVNGVTSLSRAMLRRLYEEAVAAIQTERPNEAVPWWLPNVGSLLIEGAVNDASKIAAAAIGEGRLDRVTPGMSPPLVVRIDQFQNFSADAWARLAGYGLLLSREKPGVAPGKWWTLSAADVYAMPQTDWETDPGTALGLADPVPIPMGHADGVRLSLVNYNDRWQAAGLAADTKLDRRKVVPPQARRPERYKAPDKKKYPLPATSFGYVYGMLPFLIGHGSVLPIWLRETRDDPFTRKGVQGTPINDPLSDAQSFVRTKLYLRTRPIGGPKIIESSAPDSLPGIPDKVLPLASELPIRPAPVTADAGTSAYYFRDSSGDRGTLYWRLPSGSEQTGIRLLIGNVRQFGSGGSKQPARKVAITLWGTSDGSPYPDKISPPITLDNVVDDLRVSFVINGTNDDLTILVERQISTPKYSEDEGEFDKKSIVYKLTTRTWRDMFAEVGVPSGSGSIEFEPPRADDISYGIKQDVMVDAPAIITRSQLPPELSHLSRTIHILDGITNRPFKKIVLGRPTVDFETFKRWINPALIEVSGGPEGLKDKVTKAINTAYRLSLQKGDENTPAQDEVGFEDPAIVGFAAELIETFPQFTKLGIYATGMLDDADVFDPTRGPIAEETPRWPVVRVDCAEQAKFSKQTDTRLQASLQPGHIYELRTYPVVSTSRQVFSPFLTEERLSPALKATLRRVEIGGKSYLLGSATVVTLEVATKEMPDVYSSSGWGSDTKFITTERPPNRYDDVANIYFPDDFVTGSYPAIRYAIEARLYSQRWDWSGRPEPEISFYLAKDVKTGLNNGDVRKLAEVAFLGRRDDDFGRPVPVQLSKIHIYGENPNIAGSGTRSSLFRKGLDWKAGANLWRFGLGLTSRYAAMFPDIGERLAHLPPGGTSGVRNWATYWLTDRPSRRSISRPGLALVLPLTEPLMSGGATPPLLALFNERMYANSNIGDDIDAAIEVARHPYTVSEQVEDLRTLEAAGTTEDPEYFELQRLLANHRASPTDALKYWQEVGPDPIRTSASHDGNPIGLRIDGPIGYTFDAQTERGRFDHAGILISPVVQDVGPWSMIKLRFRRHEASEGLGVKPELLALNVPRIYRLEADVFGTEKVQYEGLTVALPNIGPGERSELNFTLPTDTPSTDPILGDVRIRFERRDASLIINAMTVLGNAGSMSLPIRDFETVAVRVVLSARERPEGAEQWTPRADLVVKVRIGDKNSGLDAIARLDRNKWLNINCVPLSASAAVPTTEAVRVKITQTLDLLEARVMPTRLSTFTPPVWCQFAESMSVLNVKTASTTESQSRQCSVNDLAVTVDVSDHKIKRMKIALRDDFEGGSTAIIALLPTAIRDPEAQVEEILLAVITRYVSDAFDRLREHPIGLVHLSDAENQPLESDGKGFRIDFSAGAFESAWWADGEGIAPFAGNQGGRLRFLRMLVPRPSARGGFAPKATRQLKDLFASELLDADDLNPSDANGMILGISRPIEWVVPK